MSYPYFIVCLTGYLLLVAVSFLVPDENAAARLKRKLGSNNKSRLIAIGLFNIAVVGAAVIGFLGLFLLWPPATYLFFGAVTVRIVGDYVFGDELSMSGTRGMLAHLTVFAELLLAGLIFFGPARSLFHA